MNSTDPPRAGLSVVIAEDSPTQAEMLRETLAAEGYDVTVARNGREALEAARRLRPSIVVSDVVMPDMDGYELCRAIKADGALRHIPVLIATSLREIDDVVVALESGADNFIRKPFEPRALVARLQFLLENRRQRSPGRESGVEITLGARRHLITAGREQILDLLFSSYQEAVQANEELRERRKEVQALNLQLAARTVELEDANERLRSFCHSVSHDLRSPLATMGGFSSLLLQKFATHLEPRAVQYLNNIRQEAQRMTRIVEDVLYLANIQRSRVDCTEVDLAALARDTARALEDAEPDRRVRFECVGPARAHCDERLARIALNNLLGNAWKFTRKRPDPCVSFRAEKDGEGRTVFSVKDNGAGFDMAYADRLFKPFERLHRKDEFDGFGVGLATVHSIVTLHGGRIWAESAPGQGACFRFTFGDDAREIS